MCKISIFRYKSFDRNLARNGSGPFLKRWLDFQWRCSFNELQNRICKNETRYVLEEGQRMSVLTGSFEYTPESDKDDKYLNRETTLEDAQLDGICHCYVENKNGEMKITPQGNQAEFYQEPTEIPQQKGSDKPGG